MYVKFLEMIKFIQLITKLKEKKVCHTGSFYEPVLSLYSRFY